MSNLVFFLSFILILNFFIIIKINFLSELLNIVDKPDGILKKHKKKVFLMGGPIIFLNLTLVFLFTIFDNNFNEYFFYFNSYNQFIIFYFLSTCFFLIGLIDDKYKINPNIKFSIFIVFLSILIFLDSNILLDRIFIFNTTISIENYFFSGFFTIFCFLAFINAFNFFDGINLQAGLYSIFLILVFLFKNFLILFWLTLILSIVFYLYLNLKNHSFLGDSGSLLISFIFSYFFVFGHNNQELFTADEIFLVMMLPGLDMCRLTIERFLKRKSPLFGDRMHIHHLVEKKYNSSIAPIITVVLCCTPFIFYLVFSGSFVIILLFITLYILYIAHLKKKNV